MIDVSAWKEFRVGNYFHGIRGTSRKMQELDDGLTPIIAAARYNQGIAGYYNVPSEYENAITISCNGVGCGSTYYHDYPFAITGDAIVLENIGKVPQGALHFIASVYDAYFSRKYSYADKCSADKAEAELIALPATSDGQPDWDFMESYMKAVMKESEKSLENLKKADDTKHPINVSEWGEFRVGDLFDIHPTKAYKLTNAQLLDGGNYPVVANSAYNNGIGGYSTKNPTEQGNMVTFSDTVDANTIFYQPDAFVGYPHVQGLYPKKFEDKWNKLTYHFFVSIFRSSALSKSFDYGNKFRRDIATELTIWLPITSTGEPDWQYMEDYMKNIMNKQEMAADNLSKIDTPDQEYFGED